MPGEAETAMDRGGTGGASGTTGAKNGAVGDGCLVGAATGHSAGVSGASSTPEGSTNLRYCR